MPYQPCKNETSAESIEELGWHNSDNNAFYKTIKIDGLKTFAEKAGLTSGCDMDALTPYWSKANSILEVGAGYGRVIEYLLKHQFQGTVTAIERCRVFVDYLNKQFNQYGNIRILSADLLYLNDIGHRFDLILMLWSGIADFSPREEEFVFAKLKNLLNDQGKLIIDTLPESTIPLDMTKGNMQRVYKQEVNNVTIFTYSMSKKELYNNAKLAGLYHISYKSYYTDTNRKRLLYVLN